MDYISYLPLYKLSSAIQLEMARKVIVYMFSRPSVLVTEISKSESFCS